MARKRRRKGRRRRVRHSVRWMELGRDLVYYRGWWERFRSLLGFLGMVHGLAFRGTEFKVGMDRMLLARAG